MSTNVQYKHSSNVRQNVNKYTIQAFKQRK